MSGYDAGSLFVRIVPTAEGFGQAAAAEIKRQAPAVQQAASQAVGSSASSEEITKLRQQAKSLADSFTQAGKTIDQSLFANLQGRSAALSEDLAKLTAQGGNVIGVVGADFERLYAAEAKATEALSAYNANLAVTAVEEQKVSRAERQRNDYQSQTARGQLRNVLTGRAGAGTLDIGSIARFGAAGLAIGTVFQGLQHLSDGLKVTGDEATTTEGKLRNFGSALVTGDVVGGIIALTKSADSASESLRKLLSTEGTSTVDLRNFANDTANAAKQTDAFASSTDKGTGVASRHRGVQSAVAQAARDTAKAEREAADEATNLAKAFDTSAQAAADVGAAITAAGSAAGAFGEANRVGSTGGGPRGSTGGTVDSTATNATGNAIAESLAQRTKGLQDDLAQAKKEAAQAATLEKNLSEVAEGAASRRQGTVAAETRVTQIQQQIDDQAAAAAKQAAAAAETARKKRQAEAEQAARERKAERAAALRAAHDELANNISFAADLAQLEVRRAGLTEKTTKDDVAAEKKLIAIYQSAEKTKGLTKQERRAYVLAAANEKINLAELLNQPGQNAGGNRDLFAEAASEFSTFGSNISRGGPLSGQDARAAFAKGVLDNIPSQQLTEAQKQTALLERLLANTIDPAWTKKVSGLPTDPNAGGYKFSSGFAARAAAVSQFGAG